MASVVTRVLILDHNDETRSLLVDTAEKLGWRAQFASNGLHAAEILAGGGIDVLIADFDSPGLGGLDVVRRGTSVDPSLRVVGITSSSTVTQASEAVRLGISDYLVRPFGAVEARRLLRRLVDQSPVSGGDGALPEHVRKGIRQLVGSSPAMESVRKLVLKVADRPQPVLILGEPGTGRELVARVLHACSSRRSEPFVAIDCGALGDTGDSTLFSPPEGHNPTGRGTFFLDEVASLPPVLQARLARALQEDAVRAAGFNAPLGLEARVVAASSMDLKRTVHDGEFRPDLYYSLKVFSFSLPPLRERSGDILPLVNHFLERHGAPEGVADYSPDFMQALAHYDWPGNIRELESAIQRAVAMSSGSSLDTSALSSTLREASRSADPDAVRLRELERHAIQDALEQANGDHVRAAILLGVPDDTIERKLIEFGLIPPPGKPSREV